jgi:hypothetical protein
VDVAAPNDAVLELRNVKQSYGSRHSPLRFEFKDGALTAATERNPLEVLKFIREWLLEHPEATVTSQSLVQHEAGRGREAYEAIVRSHSWADGKAIDAGIACGLNTGVLCEETLTDGNRNRRRTLRVLEAHDV